MSPFPVVSRSLVPGWLRLRRRPFAWLSAGLVLATLAISCSTTTQRIAVVPPAIPGATYVGSDTCSQCHEAITKPFSTATHARLIAQGTNAVNVGCESCHGPGSVHAESGGAARTILHPDRNPETCFACHSNLRAEFALPYRHPVMEHRLACSACHASHQGDAIQTGASSLTSGNDLCTGCHRPQRGPHVFEHEALREGCVTCHRPHGSVNQKLLTERNAVLCLKCHFQQQTAAGRIAIGAIDHTAFLARGTCWSAGCHEAVHGSQVSSSLRF